MALGCSGSPESCHQQSKVAFSNSVDKADIIGFCKLLKQHSFVTVACQDSITCSHHRHSPNPNAVQVFYDSPLEMRMVTLASSPQQCPVGVAVDSTIPLLITAEVEPSITRLTMMCLQTWFSRLAPYSFEENVQGQNRNEIC